MTDDLEGTLEQLSRIFGTHVNGSEANSGLPYFEIRGEGSDAPLGLLMNDEAYHHTKAQTPAFRQYRDANIPMLIAVTPNEAMQERFARQGSAAARDQGHDRSPMGLDPEQYATGTNALQGFDDLGAYVERNGIAVPERLARFGTEEYDAGHARLPLIYAFPIGSTIARIDAKLDMRDRSLTDTKVSYPELGR